MIPGNHTGSLCHYVSLYVYLPSPQLGSKLLTKKGYEDILKRPEGDEILCLDLLENNPVWLKGTTEICPNKVLEASCIPRSPCL